MTKRLFTKKEQEQLKCNVDEIMFSFSIFDNEARNYSFTCLREIFE